MIDHVVLDVEIAKTIEETPGGWDATDKLGVAVACVWEERTQRMRVYGPADIDALRGRLAIADRITGYNIWAFDFPVIWSAPRGDWLAPREPEQAAKASLRLKTDDILRRIWQARGFDPDANDGNPRMYAGTKLDDIAGATLGVGKIGNGADAPKWYQAGDIQKVVNYCADDVALERDLGRFVDLYGYVICKGAVLPVAPWSGL